MSRESDMLIEVIKKAIENGIVTIVITLNLLSKRLLMGERI